jgi:peptidoglycan/xylan/chitin deacetylase (PgdA/CDA1 family)|tara:strand:+ start:1531 stop:2208 length:678 start_codon:yes stop_codon:yes gene_type:complete
MGIKMKTNVVVAIDDLHPEEDWGCEGDEQIEYLDSLNEKYGVKFNLFIPSNYHDKYPITKEWVDFWKSKDYVELSNHGHYHACKNEGVGEMEFFELGYSESVQRIQESLELWKTCGYKPKGFRAPGWGLTQESADAVSSYFDWIAGHTNINKGLSFGTQFFEGCDGINEPDSLSLYGNTFMFQSHINGVHNNNVWKEENYLHFEQVLEYLLTQYELQFVTISEIN